MKLRLGQMNSNPTLKDYKNKRINLLPIEIKQQKKQGLILVLLGVAIASVALLSATQYIQTRNKIKMVESLILEEQMIIEQLNKKESYYELLSSHVSRIETKDRVLRRLDWFNHSPTKVFKLLENSTPKDVVYMTVQFNSTNQVTINGKSSSEESIAEFLYNLKKVTVDKKQFYTNVFVSNINKTGEDPNVEYQFSIKCDFGGELNEEQ